jgi:hypothetical protein
MHDLGRNTVNECGNQQNNCSEPVRVGLVDGYVYFYVTDKLGLVKIGHSLAPELRRIPLQRKVRTKLRLALCFPGTADDERKLHRQFAHLRVQHEWFRAEPELLNFIAENLKRAQISPRPPGVGLRGRTASEPAGH